MESKQWQFRWRGQNKGKQCSASDEARHKCSYHSIFVATKVCLLILTKVFYGIEFWVRRAINSSLSSNFGRWARKSSSSALSFIITSILFSVCHVLARVASSRHLRLCLLSGKSLLQNVRQDRTTQWLLVLWEAKWREQDRDPDKHICISITCA